MRMFELSSVQEKNNKTIPPKGTAVIKDLFVLGLEKRLYGFFDRHCIIENVTLQLCNVHPLTQAAMVTTSEAAANLQIPPERHS